MSNPVSRSEEALSVSQARIAGIIAISEDAIISVDREQRITLFNAGAERIFGYTAAEALGRPLDILIPERFIREHREHVRTFASGGDVLRPMNKRGELFGRRKDGTEFPAEASISRFEVAGEAILNVRLRDITERKRDREELQARTRQQAVVASLGQEALRTGDLAALARQACRVVAETLGVECSRVLSLLPGGADLLARAGVDWEPQLAARPAAGRELSADDTHFLQAVANVLAAAIDRDRSERQLRQSQKLESVGLLAGGIAHDFNNLLTAIMGNVSLALEALPADAACRGMLENSLRASERAAELIHQLLAYAGKGRFVTRQVDLGAIVRDLTALLGATISKKVEIRLDLAPGVPSIETDPAQMQQLVMNLVINGSEAIGEDAGVITISVRSVRVNKEYASAQHTELKPGAYVCLQVRDTGAGMDEETRAHIFDPFFTTKFAGRGLGLAAVSGIVRGHHGAIEVESEPGAGSTFQILLPTARGGQLPFPRNGD